MAETNSLRGDTVIETLVNMSSSEMRGETAVETIANIVGYDVPEDLIGAILAMVGAPDDLRGETVVETIGNIVHTFDVDADVPDNLIDALVMLNEASGGEPYSDGKNLFAVSAASDGYLGDDGGFVASTDANHPLTSDFVPVKPGQSLVLQAWALTTSASGDGSIWLAYCFYDSNREPIGSTTGKYGGTTLASGQAYSTYEITVPNGAAYIRATYRRVLGGYAKLEYGEDATAWTPAPQDVTAILDEASILHADDAAMMPPLTTTVFGKSTQDGTPTPAAPVPIVSVEGNLATHPYQYFGYADSRGVTYTQNADGTITAQGTASGFAYLVICRSTDNVYNLVPGETYSIAIDSENVIGMTLTGGSYRAKINLVTIPTDGSTWNIGVGVLSGVTVNETFRVSIYHGTQVAYPPAPGGCMGVLCQGPNLLDPSMVASDSQKGVTVTPDANGWFTVKGTSNATSAGAIKMWGLTNQVLIPAGTYSLLVETEGTPLVANKIRLQAYGSNSLGSNSLFIDSAGTYTFSYSEYLSRVSVHVSASSSGSAVDGRIRLTLVKGSTAPTEYIPYVGAVVPIDLDGHELRSLPDGTRDELTVDAEGHVTLVQRVNSYSVSALTWTTSSGLLKTAIASMRRFDRTVRVISDSYEGVAAVKNETAAASSLSDGQCAASYDTSSRYIFVRDDSYSTAEAFVTAMGESIICYPLETPVTHDLGYVELPSLPSPVFNMSVSAGGEPTIMTRYMRGQQPTATTN